MTTLNFLKAAFDDYIAARVLLNNQLPHQGSTLASSAVEKYLKALLSALNINFKKVHLDRIEELKYSFSGTEYEILFNSLDENFLHLIGKAYKFRYLDNLKTGDSFGFFINQLLGELDFTISLIESLFQFSDSNSLIESPYKRAIACCDKNLHLNNYVLNRLEKSKFMRQKSQAFVISFNPQFPDIVAVAELRQELTVPYSGQIILLTASFATNR